MSKEIVRVFIKRFVDSITNDKSKFPLKDMFVKIKEDLKNISLKDQEDIVRENVLDLEDLLSECQAMFKKRELKRMKCYSPSEKFYIIKTSIQLKKIRNRLRLLKQEPDGDIQPETTQQGTPSEYQWTYGSVDTSKIYGWDERVEEINKALLKEENVGLNMVGIVGNLGTGKTALAQKIFMSDAVMDAFCLRLWVCVSPNCGLKELVWRMLDNLGVEDVDVESILNENQDKDEAGVLLFLLYVQLMEKRYLIVFDDVCECEKNGWDMNLDSEPPENSEWIGRLAFGLPKGSGSSIIVTSRFHEVAKNIVGRMNIYHPDRMPEENAWLLFKTAYEEVRKPLDERFESLKTEITKKCDGVPLALHTAGKELAKKKIDDEKIKPGTDDSNKPHTTELSMPTVTETENPQAEEKGGSQSGDDGHSIVDDINKQDNDDIRKQEIDGAGDTNQHDYDNAKPKEENTGESKQLEDGKAESRPANNNTMSVGANKDTTQDDTTNKEEGINDTNKTAE